MTHKTHTNASTSDTVAPIIVVMPNNIIDIINFPVNTSFAAARLFGVFDATILRPKITKLINNPIIPMLIDYCYHIFSSPFITSFFE